MLSPRQCRLCQKKLEKADVIAGHVYGGSKEHKFYHCHNCDVAFLYPPMTEKKERDFYANVWRCFAYKSLRTTGRPL